MSRDQKDSNKIDSSPETSDRPIADRAKRRAQGADREARRLAKSKNKSKRGKSKPRSQSNPNWGKSAQQQVADLEAKRNREFWGS